MTPCGAARAGVYEPSGRGKSIVAQLPGALARSTPKRARSANRWSALSQGGKAGCGWSGRRLSCRRNGMGALLCISAEAAFTALSSLVYTAPEKA